MKTGKQRNGISVIEMLVAMISAAILALTVGMALVSSYRGWADNNRYISLQEDASLAQSAADKWVREAAYWQVSASNNTVSITISNTTRRLYRNANTLVFDPDTGIAGNELMIATNRVSNFLATATPWGVYLDLFLNDGPIKSELHTFICFRN